MVQETFKKTSPLVRFLFAFLVALTVFVVGLYIKDTSITTYTGTLPCADCVGIKTTLILKGNDTYELHSLYIDKGDPFTEKGTWKKEIKNTMEVYALTSQSHVVSYYKIGDSTTLTMLDINANPIKSPFAFTLKKE